MVSQQHAQALPSVMAHFPLYSSPGTDIQGPILIAEFPLETTLNLEELKDLTEKEQGETETGQ